MSYKVFGGTLNLTQSINQYYLASFVEQPATARVVQLTNSPLVDLSIPCPGTSYDVTRSLAVTKRLCYCGVGQFWPNVTGRRYFVVDIGLSSTAVT